jgi:hypothetical protein
MNDFQIKRDNKVDYFKKQAEQIKKEFDHLSNLNNYYSPKKYEKMSALTEKYNYYMSRINSMEHNKSIFSDDPEAVRKLEEKIKELRDRQEEMKIENKKAMKEKKPKKYGSYVLQNNNQNIRRLKLRLEELKKKQEAETKTITKNDKFEIVDNVESNRLQVFFPAIPDKGIRDYLKSHGFRWAPNSGCWQRMRSSNQGYFIKMISDFLGK